MTKEIPNESTFSDCAFAGCKRENEKWDKFSNFGCYQSNQLSDRWDRDHRDKYSTFNAIVVSTHFGLKCGWFYVGYVCRLYEGKAGYISLVR